MQRVLMTPQVIESNRYHRLGTLTASDMHCRKYRASQCVTIPKIVRVWNQKKNSLFDPRFLIPTESSVDEARYLLASRRGSSPSAYQCIRSRSLDMVAEEQPSDSAHESNTSTPPASLGLPRYRTRSRSLDTGLKKRYNFSAFKESLKLRDVQKTRLGTWEKICGQQNWKICSKRRQAWIEGNLLRQPSAVYCECLGGLVYVMQWPVRERNGIRFPVGLIEAFSRLKRNLD